MPHTTHDKRQIALAQLETALRLFGESEDLFSVITLAGAAEEILGRLVAELGRGPNSIESIEADAKAMYRVLFGDDIGADVFADRANRARNALKHLHHEPGQSYTVTLDLHEEAEDMLDRAITNYWQLEQSLTPAMRQFTDSQRAQVL